MPKFRRYDEILRARGYKKVHFQPDRYGETEKLYSYAGLAIYRKVHTHNDITCYVKVDTHGKAQEMEFCIGQDYKTRDFETCKKVELDREYLWHEAMKIYNCFKQLKQMKSPKHVYF